MPWRIAEVLGSYNLFAKSMPGVLLLLGISTLLPTGTSLGISMGSSFANFAALIISALLFGLLLGEGVHTLANIVEQVIFSFSQMFFHRIYRPVESFIQNNIALLLSPIQRLWFIIKLLVVIPIWLFGFWITAQIRKRVSRNFGDRIGQVPIAIQSILLNIRGGTSGGIKSFYWRLHYPFKAHRQLFADSIEWNYHPAHGPWEVGEQGELYDKFARCLYQQFQIDIKKGIAATEDEELPEEADLTRDDLKKIYPLIKSELSTESTFLSSRFQATYSFCRSMWVILSLITIAYLVILYPQIMAGGSPLYPAIGVSLYPNYPAYITPITTGVSAVIFIVGSGQYKSHFIEYLLADFCVTHADVDTPESVKELFDRLNQARQ